MEDIADYNEWAEDNQVEIFDAYLESINLEDVPDEFINNYYNDKMEDQHNVTK